MYNEASLASRKLAPEGWRILTKQDFIEQANLLTEKRHERNEVAEFKLIWR